MEFARRVAATTAATSRATTPTKTRNAIDDRMRNEKTPAIFAGVFCMTRMKSSPLWRTDILVGHSGRVRYLENQRLVPVSFLGGAGILACLGRSTLRSNTFRLFEKTQASAAYRCGSGLGRD